MLTESIISGYEMCWGLLGTECCHHIFNKAFAPRTLHPTTFIEGIVYVNLSI